MKWKVRENFVVVNGRSGFSKTYARFKPQFSLSMKGSELDLPCFLNFIKRAGVISPFRSPQPMWGETRLLWILTVRREKCWCISAKWDLKRCVCVCYGGSRYLEMQVWGPVLAFNTAALWEWLYCTFKRRRPFTCCCDSAGQAINIPCLKMY